MGKFTKYWFALTSYHRRLKWVMFASSNSTRCESKEKCWVISFSDPCDVKDDVIPGPVKISARDMLSVFPCITFILNRRLCLKPYKNDFKLSVFLWLSAQGTWCGAATQSNTCTKWRFSHLWQLVSNGVNSDKEQSTKVIIPRSIDDTRTSCHSITHMAIFLFKDHSFWAM